jgi:hypothetical protein
LRQKLEQKKQGFERADDEPAGIVRSDDAEGEVEETTNGVAAMARLAREGGPRRQMCFQEALKALKALKLAQGRSQEKQGKEEDQKPPSPC